MYGPGLNITTKPIFCANSKKSKILYCPSKLYIFSSCSCSFQNIYLGFKDYYSQNNIIAR